MGQLPLTFAGRPAEPEAPAGPRIWSVSELQGGLRRDLERNYARVYVGGEVSNLKIHHVSGHAYFTLKDRSAQLTCVMWRDNVRRLRFQLADGQMVVANGKVTVYERGGSLQLSVMGVALEGLGALAEAYRQLAATLKQQGLTAPEGKRPLPMLPRCVGVVTSPQAAALRDVIRTVLRRDPRAHVIISPTPVQGRQACADIAAAIRRLDQLQKCDVILVVRGGGSVEDLWAFNEEAVARSIVDATTPIVTGVGHETDTTIADLVADRAASTPTAAAELAVPVRAEVAHRLWTTQQRLHRALSAQVQRRGRALIELTSRIPDPQSILHKRAQRIDELSLRAERRLIDRLNRERQALTALTRRLDSVAPLARLHRQRAAVDALSHRAEQGLTRSMNRRRVRFESTTRRLDRAAPHARIADAVARIGLLASRRDAAIGRAVERASRRFAEGTARLEALSPVAILSRGYAVVRDDQDRVVRSSADVQIDDRVRIRLGRGTLHARVESLDDEEAKQP